MQYVCVHCVRVYVWIRTLRRQVNALSGPLAGPCCACACMRMYVYLVCVRMYGVILNVFMCVREMGDCPWYACACLRVGGVCAWRMC